MNNTLKPQQEQTLLQYLYHFQRYDENTPDQLPRPIEIRVLRNGQTLSGYFKNVEKILEVIRQNDAQGCMIYAPFNSINTACYSREQCERMVNKPKQTTSDNDIMHRDFVLIDLDPRRPAGVNATDAEKEKAVSVSRRIYKFLVDQNGFERPIVADSGNGIHLYFRVDMANSNDEKSLVKNFLKALAVLFSDDDVDVDCSVFNAARISKIIGTTSCKGTPSDERPARISCFLNIPEEVKVTDTAYFRKIVGMLPQPEQPNRENNFTAEKFDLEQFIQKHGIEVVKRTQTSDGARLVLKECPFDPNHKDAALFLSNTGAIGYHCFHNSCANYGWREFRLHYDPEAYSRQTVQANRNWHDFKNQRPKLKPQPEANDLGNKWLQPSKIVYKDLSETEAIPTGFTRMDKRLKGLLLGEVSVLSGTNHSGKSAWLNNLIANAVQSGYKCAVWSGELQDFRFIDWLDQVLAGKNRVEKKEGFENIYFVRRMVAQKINAWLDGKLWLYNNSYGNDWEKIFNDLDETVNQGAKLVILDNLAALDLSANDVNFYQRQSALINDLAAYAKLREIHVILVCHPRKEVSFLRKESIGGSGDLTNLVDNVFIMHRVGNDFRKRATEFLGSRDVDKIMDEEKFDNVIEVCKNRSFGLCDFLLGMYYEKETRRMKNTPEECIIYGWDEQPIQQTITPTNEVQAFPYHSEIDDDEAFNAWWNE